MSSRAFKMICTDGASNLMLRGLKLNLTSFLLSVLIDVSKWIPKEGIPSMILSSLPKVLTTQYTFMVQIWIKQSSQAKVVITTTKFPGDPEAADLRSFFRVHHPRKTKWTGSRGISIYQTPDTASLLFLYYIFSMTVKSHQWWQKLKPNQSCGRASPRHLPVLSIHPISHPDDQSYNVAVSCFCIWLGYLTTWKLGDKPF